MMLLMAMIVMIMSTLENQGQLFTLVFLSVSSAVISLLNHFPTKHYFIGEAGDFIYGTISLSVPRLYWQCKIKASTPPDTSLWVRVKSSTNKTNQWENKNMLKTALI